MNKMIKLPLFLGVVGGLCGAILAFTNYFTAPKIEEGEKQRTIESYKEHFADFNEAIDDSLTEKLVDAGVSSKVTIKDADQDVLGDIYKATISTYGSQKCTFTVSFSSGLVNKIAIISQNETGQGSKFIKLIKEESNFKVDKILEVGEEAGSSFTSKAFYNCVNVCYSDYLGE